MSNFVDIIKLYREIRTINKKNIFNGEASVESISEADPLLLRVWLTPKDGLFEMAKISIKFVIPIDYPNSRPNIIFETKMFHPNVDYLTGIPCFSMVRQDWHQGYLLEHYISGLLWFLQNPCFKDPSNPVVANQAANYPTLLKTALRGGTVVGLKFAWSRVDEQPKIEPVNTTKNTNNFPRRFTFNQSNNIGNVNHRNNTGEAQNQNVENPVVGAPRNEMMRNIDTTPTSSVRQLRSVFEGLSARNS
jgi:ubiquitin-protein ligase